MTLLGRLATKLALTAVAFSALGASGPVAHANDEPGGCSRSWNENINNNPSYNYVNSGSGYCNFRLDGTPIYLYGSSSAAKAGTDVEIEVWMYPQGNPELELGSRCKKQGKGQVYCSKEDLIVPYAVSPFLIRPRFYQLPAGSPFQGVSMRCAWKWKGNREGQAGCFGPNHCPQVTDFSCQEIAGQRLDCVLAMESCSDGSRRRLFP